MDINNLYQEMIIDHGTQPRNHKVLDSATNDAEGFNPLCGDKIHVYVIVKDNVIEDISFESKGCAISTASASIMSEAIKGKTLAEANSLFAQFKNILTSDTDAPNTLGKIAALAGVRKYPSRVKCATLGWYTLQDAMRE